MIRVQDLTEILLEVGRNEKAAGHIQKYNVYVKAVNAIKAHGTRITSGAEAKRLDGVGVKIAAKIDEILASGALKKLEDAKKDPKQIALNLFNRIHGVGAVTAKRWLDADIHNIEQLRAKIASGDITLTHEQQIGLRYFDAFEKRVPRDEMLRHEALVLETMRLVDAGAVVQIVGSYRLMFI